MAEPDEVSEVLIRCTRAFREGMSAETATQLATWKNDLAVIFHIVASQIADADEFAGWHTSPSEPGYLMRRFDSLELRVPFHLFDDIPASSVPEELLSLAREIRADVTAVICLSGSSAIAGAFRETADIDFCEYLSADTLRPSALGKAISAAMAVAHGKVGCIQVSYWREGAARVDLSPPWAASPADFDAETARRGNGFLA